jgi:hypothetical protein
LFDTLEFLGFNSDELEMVKDGKTISNEYGSFSLSRWLVGEDDTQKFQNKREAISGLYAFASNFLDLISKARVGSTLENEKLEKLNSSTLDLGIYNVADVRISPKPSTDDYDQNLERIIQFRSRKTNSLGRQTGKIRMSLKEIQGNSYDEKMGNIKEGVDGILKAFIDDDIYNPLSVTNHSDGILFLLKESIMGDDASKDQTTALVAEFLDMKIPDGQGGYQDVSREFVEDLIARNTIQNMIEEMGGLDNVDISFKVKTRVGLRVNCAHEDIVYSQANSNPESAFYVAADINEVDIGLNEIDVNVGKLFFEEGETSPLIWKTIMQAYKEKFRENEGEIDAEIELNLEHPIVRELVMSEAPLNRTAYEAVFDFLFNM